MGILPNLRSSALYQRRFLRLRLITFYFEALAELYLGILVASVCVHFQENSRIILEFNAIS